ncbi:nicotinate (nicotinamide) nucleotide adenylyltransferase [Desulfosporosinus hippei]|uniref:Probable nicotinate-nucleotide adenylyltransferase n=1 Tax=Desulfosporosinus hippei DSM 8344 TaxID=1121419 RepID=A0A1G8E4X3_9FIRM|nr:nicotinate (nicotinamide) nucleotide adenylyltransferase [Desulfosporosinus hippei]SDH64927.1 nicotinate-nucleotide adenylyltransferase [Desulfosporosinus hippei DSM 8344]
MERLIAVFGGSFSPVTNAHLAIAEQITNLYDIEKVIFLPVSDLYEKSGLMSAGHRVEMLKLACESNTKFEVSEIEVQSTTLLNTIDSLRRLRKQYPDHPIAFVIGSDNLWLIDTWNDFQELMDDYYFIVIPRNGNNPKKMIRKNPSLLANLESFLIPEGYIRNDGNSTHVRDLLKVGKSVRYLVPEPTYFYLENNLKGWGFNA